MPLFENINDILTIIQDFLNDSNFKICLTAIRIITKLIEVYKAKLTQNQIINLGNVLLNKYSDNKLIVR